MNETEYKYRVFILGAGFSVPAGLPTASELFKKVKERIEHNHGKNTCFHDSIREYINYSKECFDKEKSYDNIELEEFISFLDIEHFLALEGSDTFDENGYGAQLLIKKYIGQILHERTPIKDDLPKEYYEFAKNLHSTDIIITLNYDVVLERALDKIGKPYRLFQDRYESIEWGYNVIDNSKKEISILKLHGSLDWFSDKTFLEGIEGRKAFGLSGIPRDPIFNNDNQYGQYPLVDGPREKDDPFVHIHRLKGIDSYYAQKIPPLAPVILSPSYMKIVYADSFIKLWHGLGKVGRESTGLSIIGFSLPKHDDYLRVTLYKMIKNYQKCNWDFNFRGTLKDNVKLVDLRLTKDSKEELIDKYKFIEKEKLEVYTNGFSSDAVKFLFTNKRSIKKTTSTGEIF